MLLTIALLLLASIMGLIVGLWIANLSKAIDAEMVPARDVTAAMTLRDVVEGTELAAMDVKAMGDLALYSADRQPIVKFHTARFNGQSCLFLEAWQERTGSGTD